MQHFDVIGQGTIPVILHLPHNARYLPEDFDWGLDPESLEKDIFRLVDHQTISVDSIVTQSDLPIVRWKR